MSITSSPNPILLNDVYLFIYSFFVEWAMCVCVFSVCLCLMFVQWCFCICIFNVKSFPIYFLYQHSLYILLFHLIKLLYFILHYIVSVLKSVHLKCLHLKVHLLISNIVYADFRLIWHLPFYRELIKKIATTKK